MFCGVRTQNVLKLTVFKGQLVDILNLNEVGHIAVLNNIRIDAAAINVAATDIQVSTTA